MKSKVDKREEAVIPTYTLGKKQRHGPKLPLKWVIIIALLVLFTVVIYVPPMIFDEPDTNRHVSLSISPNSAAMEEAITYLRNNPTADFDGDGLTNEQESSYNTGVYKIDNDGDGVTDYAELYITGTNPCVYDDAIIQYVIDLDAKSGNSVNTPFKVHNITMWADDYESKAKGSVIEIYEGNFKFSGFTGWVRFPDNEYAYLVENGYQTLLPQNEQGYYHISSSDGDVIVRAYTEPLTTCHVLSLLGNKYQIKDNFLGKALTFIFPSRGFGLMTCRPATMADLDGTWDETGYFNDPVQYTVNELDSSRFTRDQNQLSDLSNVMRQIDAGNNAIISLMSHITGEVILEVYGYTDRNNLLVCDPATGESLGVLNITIISKRLLDKSGNINQYEYFEFNGCGYSSANRHRIAVIDFISSSGVSLVEPEKEREPEPEPEPPPIVSGEQMATINEILYYYEDGEVSFYENGGRFQRTVGEVQKDAVSSFIDMLRTEYGFSVYYDDDGTTEEMTSVVLSNEYGDIVSVQYTAADLILIIRYEATGSEQTIELESDKFVVAEEDPNSGEAAEE